MTTAPVSKVPPLTNYLQRLAAWKAVKALQAPLREELQEQLATLDREERRVRYDSTSEGLLLDGWTPAMVPELKAGWASCLYPVTRYSDLLIGAAARLWILEDAGEKLWGVEVCDPYLRAPALVRALGPLAALSLRGARDAAEELVRAAGWAPILRGETLGAALSALPEDPGLDLAPEEKKAGVRVVWLKLRGGAAAGGRQAWLEESETEVYLNMNYADRPALPMTSMGVYDLGAALRAAATFLRGPAR